jgi:hypothetical protein
MLDGRLLSDGNGHVLELASGTDRELVAHRTSRGHVARTRRRVIVTFAARLHLSSRTLMPRPSPSPNWPRRNPMKPSMTFLNEGERDRAVRVLIGMLWLIAEWRVRLRRVGERPDRRRFHRDRDGDQRVVCSVHRVRLSTG